MIWSGVKCTTGIFAHHDIDCGPQELAMMTNVDQESSLTRKEQILVHVVEVLYQVYGADIVEGGCVGGDAWLDSIPSCVEILERKKVF